MWSFIPDTSVFGENSEFVPWRKGCLLLANMTGSLSFGDMEINGNSSDKALDLTMFIN